MASATQAAGRADKSKKQSRIVVLRLSPQSLSRFSNKKQSKSSSSTSAPVSASASPTPTTELVETVPLKRVPSLSGDNGSESNSTPAPGQDGTVPSETIKKRKAPAAGPRKSLNTNIDTMQKPRGKPGPKKKPRLEDGTIDHSAKPTTANTANHKLGPKANTGAINAGLRALDRTGTPCRKWARKGFQLKSFTGVVWEVPTWKGGEDSALAAKSKDGDSSTENKDISMQSSSDMKPNGSDVAMESNIGDQPDLMALSTPAASSPAPMPASISIAA